jgi:hypothetical protein
VNLLYYLARTDAVAWTPELTGTARELLAKIKMSDRPGHQWRAELEGVEALLKRAGGPA